MRNIQKLTEPEILASNKESWLHDYLEDKDSATKKYRYRHPEIKQRLKDESGTKCVYCESKIGHNTPGDIEHKVPSSKDETLHFTWSNLAIACTECNRRKNDYYEEGNEFLDPHSDDVEAMLEHHGPLVMWTTGEHRAEISVRILQLNNESRKDLIVRKSQAIMEFNDMIERYSTTGNSTLKKVLYLEIHDRVLADKEYSAMLREVARRKGVISS